VKVEGASGATDLKAKNIIIATGSVPVELPHIPFDGIHIVSSTEALSFEQVPKSLAVIGGGVIGLELGSVWSRLGSQVTVFEYADRIVAGADTQVSKDLLRILKKQGLSFITGAKVTGAQVKKGSVELKYETPKGSDQFQAERVLVAVGRKPYTEGLGLENVGITLDERGRVPVDEHLRTKVPHIFAIGDVIAGPMLAHKAEEEGVAVAEFLATGYGHVNYECCPSVIYTWPEVAWVGSTEEQLKEAGRAYLVGTFPIVASGRAKALGMTEGRIKILADANTDKILGAHIVGPNASELIHEVVVAMEFGGSSEDLARSFHAHPTLAEGIREAALDVQGRIRQIPPR
jgi:dihydrolipoamide dehydrogenase